MTTPREKPIRFLAPMVRAILDGRKTQTRRIVQPTPLERGSRTFFYKRGYPVFIDERRAAIESCPYGGPGDHLWVRETFSYDRLDIDRDGMLPCWYWADGNPRRGDWTIPKPSIHMPRWASRITLRIKSVRVERLQEISEQDAIAEGVLRSQRAVSASAAAPAFFDYMLDQPNYCSARSSYSSLWESINGPGSWEKNPWVWVLEFERTP